MEQIKHVEENLKIRNIRHVGMDIVKSIAILSVIGVHFFLNTKFYTTNLNNFNLFFQTILQQLFLACIPLFLISTGYLNNSVDISKKYFKKIVPILILYILYSIPAILYRAHIKEIETSIPLWISLIFKFKGNRYSWYIDLYIGLFLLIPFLNRMYNTLNSKKEKQTLIFILIMLTSMVPLVNGKIIKQFYLTTYWTSIYPLTYFFVGKYIKDFQPQIKTHLNVIYLLLIIIIQGSIEYYVASGEVYKHFFTDYTSILRLIQGCLIFTLLYKANIKNEFMHKHITNISMLTLDIYLASFITDRIVYKEILKGFTFTQETYLYIMIPLIIASFALAYIIAIIRKKFIKLR